jgi:hypothetical protein
MAELRGRPFAFVALTLCTWVGARVALTGSHDEPLPAATIAKSANAQPKPTMVTIRPADASPLRATIPAAHSSRHAFVFPAFRPPPALDPWQDGGRPSGLPTSVLVAGGGEPLSTGRDTPPTNALAPVGKAGPPENKRHWGADVYAYSFWRFATGNGQALAPGAQYGGSQSGVIGTVDPFGEPDKGLAFLARGAITPNGDERELALGLRWKPDANWPFLLSAERRFRADAPDRFAAYVAGGVDALALTRKWQLDAYGQAGYATGRGGGGFFDGQARVTRPIAKVAGVPLSIGAGSWAGGQRGTRRLDAGPTAVARINTGPAVVVIQLDWRLRAAGNAEPKDGVAMTVSTGF